jgi:hypothetical protein
VLKRVVLETLQQVLPATTYGVEVEYLGRMPQGKPVYKNSYHLVIPGAVFEHNATGCMGDFVKQVLWPELEKHKEMLWIQPKNECIVDRAIYTRTRQIRMPGCSKFGGVGLQVATLEDLHRMRTSYYYAEQDRQTPVITMRMVAEMLPPPPPPPPVKRRRENATSSNSSNSISPKRVKHVASYALCAALTAWLKAKGDHTSTVKPDGNVYLVMNPNAGSVARVCVCDPTGQTTHMRNNGKITINENTRGAWFHCWSDKCQHKDVRIGVLELGASSSSSMVMVDEEEEEEKVYVPRPASSSSMVVMGEEEEGEKVYVPPPTATAVVVAEVPWTDNRQYLDTTERYLTEDTRLNLTHADGRAFASTWKNKMLLAGTPQNTGKTRWSNQLVVGRREHGTVVVVSPLISLTHQTARQLTDESGDLKVLHYKDGIRQETTNLLKYDALVSTVFSLSRFTYPENIGTLILDEARCILSQVLDWGGNDEQGGGDQRLDSKTTDRRRSHALKSRAALMGLGIRADVLVALCAQITRLEVDLLLSLLGRPNTDVIELRMDRGVMPVTEVNNVQDLGRMIQRILESVTSGGTVVVSCNVASFGRRLARHITDTNLTRDDSDEINVITWDSKWLARQEQGGRNPAADMGRWIVKNNIQLVVHTTAVSPGMSIDGDGIVTQRYMVLLPYGADAMSMSQMADRVRKPVNRNLYMFSTRKPRDARTPSPKKDREHAIGVLLQRYPEEAQPHLPVGPEANVTDMMVPSQVNEYRLKRITERYLNKRCPLVQQVVDLMTNTHITDADDTVVDLPDGWNKSLNSAEAAEGVKFFARDELELAPKVDIHGDGTRYQRADAYLHIAEMLPPAFVRTKKPYTLDKYSLAPDAFRQVVSGNGYHKLCNFVSWVRLSGRLHGQALATWVCTELYPNEAEGRNMAGPQKVSRCVQSLLTLVGGNRVDARAITQGTSTYDSLPSTEAEKKAAYKWMQEHWSIVTEITTNKFRVRNKLTTIPEEDSTHATATWMVLLKNVLITQLGLGCRTTTIKTATSSSNSGSIVSMEDTQKVQIVPASFWKQMNVDMCSFVVWLQTERSKLYGPLPVMYESCVICNGNTSDRTECRLQGGIPLCPQHRESSEPLDTERAEPEKRIDWNQQQQQLSVHQQQGHDVPMVDDSDEKEEEYIVDRLLKYVGFTDGRYSTNTMTHEQMEVTVTTSPRLSKSEMDQVLELYNVDIKQWVDADNIKALRRQLKVILEKDVETHVIMIRTQQRQNNAKVFAWNLQ